MPVMSGEAGSLLGDALSRGLQYLQDKDQGLRNKSIDYRAFMDSPGMPFDDALKAVIYSPAVMAKLGKVLEASTPVQQALEFIKARYPRQFGHVAEIREKPLSGLKGSLVNMFNKKILTIDPNHATTEEAVNTLMHEIAHATQQRSFPKKDIFKYNQQAHEYLTSAQKEGNPLVRKSLMDAYKNLPHESRSNQAGQTAEDSFQQMLQWLKYNGENQ